MTHLHPNVSFFLTQRCCKQSLEQRREFPNRGLYHEAGFFLARWTMQGACRPSPVWLHSLLTSCIQTYNYDRCDIVLHWQHIYKYVSCPEIHHWHLAARCRTRDVKRFAASNCKWSTFFLEMSVWHLWGGSSLVEVFVTANRRCRSLVYSYSEI